MKKFFSLMLAVMLVLSMITGVAMADEEPEPVAKVGSTEYTTIGDAIAAWTNGTTLTLLADVTLSDVYTFPSTESRTLQLGTYTMTAASGKNAIEITCNGQSTATYGLKVYADAESPGGITAIGKTCIYYRKSGTTQDRVIIEINGGVYNGSYAINVYSSNRGTNCPQVNINGGVFNGNVNIGHGKLIASGGTFNGWVNCTGDQTAYRQISGGKFKSWQFMTADASNKFWVGTSQANYNVGCYVDDDGYLVVGGPVITEADDKFEASSTNYGGWSSYLQYSSAKDNGLYYTSVEEALADNNKTSGVVTVYVDELDMTNISYKGTIILADGQITVRYPDGVTPTWTVETNEENKGVAYFDTVDNGVVTRTYSVKNKYTVSFNVNGGDLLSEDSIEVVNTMPYGELPVPTRTGYDFDGWYLDGDIIKANSIVDLAQDVTLVAEWNIKQYTITFVNEDGTELQSGLVLYGETPEYTGATPTKAATAQYTYTFADWDPAIDKVTGDITYTATYTATLNNYTVTWKNWNGDVLDTDTVEFGTTPKYTGETPTKSKDSKYTYTFAGWEPEIKAVDGEATYTAAFTAEANPYKIYIKNHLDKLIYVDTVKYDEAFPSVFAPFRQGYEFIGWTYDLPTTMPDHDVVLIPLYRQTYFQIDTPVKPITPVTPVVPSEPEVDDDSCDGKLSSGCAAATFADLDSSAWYHDAVDYVLENGLMQGVGGGKFAPYTTTSRAMIVTILYRLEGEPVVGSANPFSDVEADEWYTDAVLWAAENEIVLGYDGAFMPEDEITLEQVLLILQRYAEYKGADEITVPMIAPYEYSTWAENGVVWAYLNGVLEIGTDLSDLTAPATRAELAGFLYAFCER